MAETRDRCDRFADWLLDGGDDPAGGDWQRHLEECGGCRAQWQAHRALALTFAAEPVPELSPAFATGLERKLASGAETRRLRGWRLAALLAYAGAALGLLGWALRDVPLPAIDPAAPWVAVATLLAVPLSLLVAIAASRWMPRRGAPLWLTSRAL